MIDHCGVSKQHITGLIFVALIAVGFVSQGSYTGMGWASCSNHELNLFFEWALFFYLKWPLSTTVYNFLPPVTEQPAFMIYHSILHRCRNRSGWSGHGQTILSRSWDIIQLLCDLVPRLNNYCCSKIWIRKCASIRLTAFSIAKL